MKGDEDTLKMLEDVIDQIEISEGRTIMVGMLRNFVVGRRRAEMEALAGMSPASRNESKEGLVTEIESNWWREKQRIIDQQARLIEIMLEALRLIWRGDIREEACQPDCCTSGSQDHTASGL